MAQEIRRIVVFAAVRREIASRMQNKDIRKIPAWVTDYLQCTVSVGLVQQRLHPGPRAVVVKSHRVRIWIRRLRRPANQFGQGLMAGLAAK